MIKFASLGRDDDKRRKEAGRGEFIIGQDQFDHWIVMETHGRCGGFFASQEEALRYAKRESKGHPDLVRIVPHVISFCPLAPSFCSGISH